MTRNINEVALEMFFILGKLRGMLEDEELRARLTKAVTDPVGGARMRAHLLQTNEILGEVLAVQYSPFPTSH